MKRIIFLALATAFVFASAVSHAQIKIPYQGRLTDNVGEPVPNGV